jgi:hypothetical protein
LKLRKEVKVRVRFGVDFDTRRAKIASSIRDLR